MLKVKATLASAEVSAGAVAKADQYKTYVCDKKQNARQSENRTDCEQS